MPLCKKCGLPKVLTEGGRIKCRPCERAYQMAYYYAHPATKERKRLDMARRRRTPSLREAVLASGRKAYANGGREKQRVRVLDKKAKFFPWRIQFARRFNPALTVEDIETLWINQKGRCALTGRILDSRAELDHIIPQSRGGNSELENLRWVCPEANRLKRELLDDELLELCQDTIEYLGRRIMEVDNHV